MKGFSLIELMVVLLICTVATGTLLMSFSAGRSSWHESDTQIAIQQELRKAERSLIDDFRQSSTTQISIPSNGTSCTSATFNISQGALSSGAINWSSSPVSYSLNGTQLIRTQGASTRVIANNITSLTFVRYGNSTKVVRMNLTSQRNTVSGRLLSASLASEADLRN
jgi:prepilin-type N-terminal cleavage/methylation domain-containing protein